MNLFRRSRVRFLIIGLTLILLLLILAGCGGRRRERRQAEATPIPIPTTTLEYSVPAPPLAPASFESFDNRAYTPDRLIIPAIDLDTPVVPLGWSSRVDEADRIFSEWDVAAYAAGWHKNSARLGEGGNVVLSGHNNILGAVFRELDQLRKGDRMEIFSGGVRYTYQIDKVLIVPETRATPEQRKANAQWIQPFDDDRLTLVSCWPRDDNTHRIIVVGYRVDGPVMEGAQASAR